MTKGEITKIRKAFNNTVVEYSKNLLDSFFDYSDDKNFIELTEEILAFLDTHLSGLDIAENYASTLGEIVYISLEGWDIFPLDETKKMLESTTEESKPKLTFYSFFDIENLVIKSVADDRGFLGIMDSESYVSYNNFEDLFIYTVLKVKNGK